MSDDDDLLRRIVERIVERELGYLSLDAARKVARRVADEVLEEMRRARIKAAPLVPPWPSGEDC